MGYNKITPTEINKTLEPTFAKVQGPPFLPTQPFYCPQNGMGGKDSGVVETDVDK